MTASRHAAASGARQGRLRVVLGIAAIFVVGAVVGALVIRGTGLGGSGPSTAPAAVASTSPSAELPSRPTMLAQVVRIIGGDEVVVRVASTEMPIKVLGLDTPDAASANGAAPQCGGPQALTYANEKLTGQMVTLVPDPTQPELDQQGLRLSYVVLKSQLSYTDAAISDGIGRADTSRPLWYADVFAREQREAAGEQRGIWGAPCNASP